MSRLALAIDLERCIGCKSCEAACKAEHGLGPHEYRSRVQWLCDLRAPVLDFLMVTCQQCERPACLRACPVSPKAIVKDVANGVICVDESRCTGCGECILACPYGAMGYDPVDHHAVKCDLCSARRALGEQPACASVCPSRAIQFGKRDTLLADARAAGRSVCDYDDFLLGPATLYLDRMPKERRVDTVAERQPPAVLADARPRAALDEVVALWPYRTLREQRTADRIEIGGCNICFNACSLKFHFRGDRLVRVTGNDEDPVFQGRVCPKSQMTLQLYENRWRLTQPLKRVGRRGEGRFEPITWDSALDEIATKLRSVREAHGPEALAIHAGTRTGVLTIAGYIKLFVQMWGTPNYEGTEPLCASGKNIAYRLVQGDMNIANVFTDDDIGAAKLYVFIGDNQAETRPVAFGMVNDWRVRHGAKLVVVDPRLTPTAAKADRWLAIRSGTDMALGLALAYHIFAARLHDEQFCRDWIVGWQAWSDFIRQRGFSPEWAEPITGIPAEEIRRLAEEIAVAGGCMIFAGRGINQHSNSAQTNRVLMFLAAITGNWGRKGGGYFNTPAIPELRVEAPLGRRAPVAKPAVRHNPAGWIEAMTEGKPYPIRALITCNNPLAQWPSQREARAALEALDLVVHIELFANATSAYADYVLPAATGIEKGGLSRIADDRRIVWIDKLIDPPAEAKSDHWIWIELGKRFGFDDVLREEYKDPAVFWDEVVIRQSPELAGCTQRRLHATRRRWLRAPLADEAASESDTLFLSGTEAFGQPGKRFPSPSGKLEFWTEAMEQRFTAVGLSALPEFYSEREQLIDLPYLERLVGDHATGVESPFASHCVWSAPARIVSPHAASPGAKLRAQGFDTELVTGRPPAPHFHSWTHYFWQAQEMWPDLFVQIHPEKAGAIGVADGERVRVETAHGAIEARAWVTLGIRSNTVFVPIGWDERQPFNPWPSVNFVSDRSQRDPVSDQVNLKTLLCRVSAAR